MIKLDWMIKSRFILIRMNDLMIKLVKIEESKVPDSWG